MFRLVFMLFALLSLAAAQYCDSCLCGNSACCQNPYASASPYSVFNFGYGPQYSYVGQQYGHGAALNAKISCLKVNPVPKTLTKVYENLPVFTRIVPNSEDNRQIDNLCQTLFPLPDDRSTYVVYDSTVYIDGSNSVKTTIATDVGIGTYQRGNAFASFTQREFGRLGNNIYIGCTQEDYGDSGAPSVYATSLRSVSPLDGGCIQQIQSIIQCMGQQDGAGLYVLPYRLPTRCVTQQVCSLVNPLLSSNNNYPYNYPYNGRRNGIF